MDNEYYVFRSVPRLADRIAERAAYRMDAVELGIPRAVVEEHLVRERAVSQELWRAIRMHALATAATTKARPVADGFDVDFTDATIDRLARHVVKRVEEGVRLPDELTFPEVREFEVRHSDARLGGVLPRSLLAAIRAAKREDADQSAYERFAADDGANLLP